MNTNVHQHYGNYKEAAGRSREIDIEKGNWAMKVQLILYLDLQQTPRYITFA